MILSWYELPDEDRPPERIWLDDDAIESHFEAREQERSSKSGDSSLVPQAGMERNELTADLLRK